jgi:hypothetical protein
MWIKPDDSGSSDAGQVLFETGAAAIGTTMWYQPGASNDNQGTVLWTIDAGDDTTQVSTVSAVIDTFDFTHVAFVYKRNFSGTTDLMELYVNGNLVATNAMVGLDDWSGADGSGLGNKGGSGVAFSAGSGRYVGDMSVLRFWQGKAISASDVMNNYSAALKKRVVNNAPTGMYPTQAELNGSVNALGTNYDVYVYWGTTNGGTNTAGWTTNTYVTSVTDEVANVSHTALGLTEAQDYYYTFAASNATAMLWAEPSWRFTTLPTDKETPWSAIGRVPRRLPMGRRSPMRRSAEAQRLYPVISVTIPLALFRMPARMWRR